jgi:cyclopropane fatty-acyl-phospholipid synthase-like methyltransferase
MTSEFGRDYFNEKFEGAEWGFFESDYEQRKYDRTLTRAVERKPDAENILELATGPGAFTEKVLEAYPEAEYTGLDISDVAVETAEHVASDMPNPERAQILQNDMTDFARDTDEDYDLVFMSESVYYPHEVMDDREFQRFCQDLEGLVSEDGFLISSNIHRENSEEPQKNDKETMAQIRKALENGGLETLEVAMFPDEPKTYGDKGYREHDYAIWVMTSETQPEVQQRPTS